MNRKTTRALIVICTVLFVAAFVHCGRSQSTAADGAIYVATDAGEIWRLENAAK